MRCGRFGAFEFSRAVKFVMTGGGISFVSVSRAKLSASAPVDVSFVWTSDGFGLVSIFEGRPSFGREPSSAPLRKYAGLHLAQLCSSNLARPET